MRLKSGREVEGIIGLPVSGSLEVVYEGFDGHLIDTDAMSNEDTHALRWMNDYDDHHNEYPELTREEKQELALLMASRWCKWGQLD